MRSTLTVIVRLVIDPQQSQGELRGTLQRIGEGEAAQPFDSAEALLDLLRRAAEEKIALSGRT